MTPARATLILALSAASVAAHACARRSHTPNPGAAPTAAPTPAPGQPTTDPAPTQPPTQSPAQSATQSAAGLEMWVWLVSDPRAPRVLGPPDRPPPDLTVIDPRADLEPVLLPYLDRPLPIDPDAARRWADSGLRLVAVPRRDLPRLEAQLRLVGAVQRQWMGQLPIWTQIARGPSRGPTAATIDAAPQNLPAGAPRLLARAWIVPRHAEGHLAAALRLELVPHIATRDRRPTRRLDELTPPVTTSPLDEGATIDALALGATLLGEEALLIIPEDPGSPWREPAADAFAPPPPDRPAPKGPAEPTALGPLMLWPTPADADAPRVRQVLVLIPRVPPRFELLPVSP